MSRCGIDPDDASRRLLAIAYGRFERVEVIHQPPGGLVEGLSDFGNHDLARGPQNKLCAKMPFERADLFADCWLSDSFLPPDGGKAPALDKAYKQPDCVQSVQKTPRINSRKESMVCPNAAFQQWIKLLTLRAVENDNTGTKGTER